MVGQDEAGQQVPDSGIKLSGRKKTAMRNLKNRTRKYPGNLYTGVALLTIAAVIAVAVYGTLWKGGADDGGHASAVELTDEPGHGHELAKVTPRHDGGHHDAALTHEREAAEGRVFAITLDAEEWLFEPAVLEVPVGHRVELSLVNHGMVEHDVEVIGVPVEDIEVIGAVEGHERLGGGHHDEGVIAAHADPGTTATVVFTVTKVGEYEFACTIPGHKEAGMVGKLVVTE